MNQSYFYLKMKEHKLKVPYTGKERRVRILLPKDYEKDTDRSYPVVYFHDGQNVFNSKESFIGHSWKIIPAIKRNPDISRMIVVAIDNDGMGRMNEFVMEVVKPFIDETYRTKADCQHTAMIGSSLGGNITQFIGLEYQDQIGCLGVFSSANWLHQEAFNRYIECQKLSPDQRIFIYVGTEEADDTDKTLMDGNIKQAYIDSSLCYYHDLIAGGVHLDNLVLKVQSGAIHSEIPWSENLPDCLRFFAEKW